MEHLINLVTEMSTGHLGEGSFDGEGRGKGDCILRRSWEIQEQLGWTTVPGWFWGPEG